MLDGSVGDFSLAGYLSGSIPVDQVRERDERLPQLGNSPASVCAQLWLWVHRVSVVVLVCQVRKALRMS